MTKAELAAGVGNSKEGKNSNVEHIANSKKNHNQLLWSVVTIFCVAVSTGYGSQVKYSLLNDNPEHFYPPFAMMWFNNCCLLICFPCYLLYEKFRPNGGESTRKIWQQSAQIFSRDGFLWGPFLAKELFFLALYVVGNYSYALSLGKITSSAALTIRSFEVSVVYLLGRLVLKERFFVLKTIAVFLAMAGVILIAVDRQFAANLVGVLLILLCCATDSAYKICFKKMAGDASLGQAMLFLSGMAVLNLPTNFVPTSLLIHFGVDIWQWEHVPWANLLNFVFLTFVFNIATIFGVALLSPLVISIGVLCGIPISIGMDVMFRGRQLKAGFLVGACSLLVSVILANFHEQIGRIFGAGTKSSANSDIERPPPVENEWRVSAIATTG